MNHIKKRFQSRNHTGLGSMLFKGDAHEGSGLLISRLTAQYLHHQRIGPAAKRHDTDNTINLILEIVPPGTDNVFFVRPVCPAYQSGYGRFAFVFGKHLRGEHPGTILFQPVDKLVVDMLIMRFTDIIMSVPSLLAIMAVVVLVGPSIFNVMAVIGLLGWPGTTRLVRGQILSVREWDYVLAARCLGVPNKRIMLVHVLPNVVAPLVVAATLGVAGAILTEAGLSFLGLGTPPPTPSWGSMLNAARSFTVLERYAWVWVPPGTMILITVLAINFIGDGLRDAMDPRMNLL